ncbi:MAG: hypothetical protein HFG56_13220 [Lachnospiraceae bacterium]|jgi:hypothetical protein|nr:hypothetical protein [Lachnospiraceae bacterium]
MLQNSDGKTSFGNDDYIADLDVANITFYMEKDGISYQEATKKYHSELQKGASRATIFCRIHKYEDVEKVVLDRLGIKNLKELKSNSLNREGERMKKKKLRNFLRPLYGESLLMEL